VKPGVQWIVEYGGISEPKSDSPRLKPDILLVPLWLSIPLGWRLGYGGGFFDRTLRALRAAKPSFAIGLVFDEQQSMPFRISDYDERLDGCCWPSGPISA